jgi:hypothetical protein
VECGAWTSIPGLDLVWFDLGPVWFSFDMSGFVSFVQEIMRTVSCLVFFLLVLGVPFNNKILFSIFGFNYFSYKKYECGAV